MEGDKIKVVFADFGCERRNFTYYMINGGTMLLAPEISNTDDLKNFLKALADEFKVDPKNIELEIKQLKVEE